MSRRRQRRWSLEVRDRRIYVIRDGRELTSFASTKMGPIKDVSIGKEQAKGSNQALLVSLRRIIVLSVPGCSLH